MKYTLLQVAIGIFFITILVVFNHRTIVSPKVREIYSIPDDSKLKIFVRFFIIKESDDWPYLKSRIIGWLIASVYLLIVGCVYLANWIFKVFLDSFLKSKFCFYLSIVVLLISILYYIIDHLFYYYMDCVYADGRNKLKNFKHGYRSTQQSKNNAKRFLNDLNNFKKQTKKSKKKR